MPTRGFCCKCGKLLLSEEFICDNCYHQYFEMVKEYLKENKCNNFKQIASDLKIPYAVIELFLQNGDLQEIDDTNIAKAIQQYELSQKKEADRQRKLQALQGLIKLDQEQNKPQEVVKKRGPKMRFMGTQDEPRRRR